jgi:CxxC-x17-CxxC domain-containing protein
LTDQHVACAACQREFVITPSERLFYAERGYQEPTYCPECRARRRAERHSELMAVTGHTHAKVSLGTYGGFAPPGPRGAEGSSRFTATCSSCGGEAVVPFEPRPGRPIYCRRCHQARRGR